MYISKAMAYPPPDEFEEEAYVAALLEISRTDDGLEDDQCIPLENKDDWAKAVLEQFGSEIARCLGMGQGTIWSDLEMPLNDQIERWALVCPKAEENSRTVELLVIMPGYLGLRRPQRDDMERRLSPTWQSLPQPAAVAMVG